MKRNGLGVKEKKGSARKEKTKKWEVQRGMARRERQGDVQRLEALTSVVDDVEVQGSVRPFAVGGWRSAFHGY